VVVAIPVGEASVDLEALGSDLGPGFDPELFPGWLVVRAEGPFDEPADALQRTALVFAAAVDTVEVDRYPELRFYVDRGLRTTCQTLASLGQECGAIAT
jgi:hypothetical protein